MDMRTVVTIADDCLIRIWDLGRGLPEGKTTSMEYKDANVWTQWDRLLLHTLSVHTSDIKGLTMTANGKFVVTCKY